MSACVWFHLASSCRFQDRAAIRSQTRMAEPKMASGRVASPGDSFQGEMLPPIQATHHLICRDFTGATGLEPATSGVTGRRSNQLNYAPKGRSVYLASQRSEDAS